MNPYAWRQPHAFLTKLAELPETRKHTHFSKYLSPEV